MPCKTMARCMCCLAGHPLTVLGTGYPQNPPQPKEENHWPGQRRGVWGAPAMPWKAKKPERAMW